MNSNQKSVDYLQQDFRNDRVDIKHSVQTKLHELITSSAEQRQVREINTSNLIILGGLISFQKLMLVTVWGGFLPIYKPFLKPSQCTWREKLCEAIFHLCNMSLQPPYCSSPE